LPRVCDALKSKRDNPQHNEQDPNQRCSFHKGLPRSSGLRARWTITLTRTIVHPWEGVSPTCCPGPEPPGGWAPCR
jgi:hypothetical protein